MANFRANQRKMLSEMERELRKANKKQMREMVNKWKQEKNKFYNFLEEDRGIEGELTRLFEKYKLA